MARPLRKLHIMPEASTCSYEEAVTAFTRVTEILLRAERRMAADRTEPVPAGAAEANKSSMGGA